MSSEGLQGIEDKQKLLQEKLSGPWAEDIWVLAPKRPERDRRFLRFTLASPSLKVELKYALWSKFASGQWNIDADQKHLCGQVGCLIQWLNQVTPTIQSMMERSIEQWEALLRIYLVETGRISHKRSKWLSARQEYTEGFLEDPRILLFRQIYKIIEDTYFERPEMEKDDWDLRKMGLALNLSAHHYHLNFTRISQPWLRQLAKDFMKYCIGVHSPGDCFVKLGVITGFSQFLLRCHPHMHISGINRALMVQYISFLVEQRLSERRRISILSCLRTFLETCAYQLGAEGVPKERLIFDSDFPKDKLRLPREIPQEVLKQLREHLETLDTVMLRMVVILLECGMRISELCTLPLDCLIYDDRHDWYLRFYQLKSKREHIIPLVNKTVVGVIQAQQQEIRQRYGQSCPYLFPSMKTHTLPFKQLTFSKKLNKWAIKMDIRDSAGKLYRFQSHQFRHSVGMRLMNDDIPLDIISRLLGHRTVGTTRIYAQMRPEKVQEELKRLARKRKTINSQGKLVVSDIRTNNLDAQLASKEIRGQTLPVGGCGRPVVNGDCEHANKCVTCRFWLTSTEDLPMLKAFHSNALRLKRRGLETGNRFVVRNQENIIPYLALRIAKLEDTSVDSSLSVEDLLARLRADLLEAESALEESREAGKLVAAKEMERIIVDLKAEIAALEESL